MSSYVANTDTRKGDSSKDSNVVRKPATSQGLNPAAPAFVPKSGTGERTDKDKTTSGPEASNTETLDEEEFPGLTETHPIPVWISQESGQELSASQQRRRRRWRKSAREAEARKDDKEKEKLRKEYQAMNEYDAKPSNDANRRRQYKKKGEGFLNNV